MKKSTVFSYAAILALAFFVCLPLATVVAQTNFVKHSGNPILPLGAAGEWDDTEAAYAHVLYDGSTYKMWYSGSPNQNTYRIGYATSSDGIAWDKFGMVLGTGAPGSFDGIDAWLPWVLFDGTQYEMWYAGNTSSGGIGYITTADPASWTRQRTTPVLTGGGFNAWDNFAFGPVVLHTDTLYQMWYGGRAQNSGVWQTGYATSPDGINWTKHPNNPVLTVGASSEWDAVAAIVGSVVFDDGLYHMYYHGTNGDPFSGGEIGYATSPDGVTWTKHPDNPIMTGTPGTWDDDNTWFPRVLKDGERFRMWYCRGSGSNGFDRLGYAEDFSNAQYITHVITTSADSATGVSAADLDGDGDTDVLSADYGDDTITWYENDGSQNFTAHTVATGIDGAVVARAVDINDDGHLDVISVANLGNQIAWHENDGNESFTTHVLVSNYNCAVSVEAADLDQDGDMDLLTAACIDDRLFWLENDGSENFTTHTFATGLNNATMVRAVDFDNDGDLDVLCSEWNTGGTLLWYENDGNQNFTASLIATAADGFRTYHAIDLDDDGDMDVVSTTPNTDQIQWHENDGSASFTNHTITTDADFAHNVLANDLDADGDIDVIASSRDDNTVRWFENDGDENFTPHIITSNADYVLTIFAADVDGDGDTDVLSASANDDKVAWYENLNPVVGIAETPEIPSAFALEQNYPNPFNPSTTIEFTLMKTAAVTIKVFDVLGKEVATLVDNEVLAAGSYQRVFDARHLASGIYLYQMQAGSFTQTRKLVLLR